MAKQYSRVYVEITNICNRSCSFCPGTKRELKSLTAAEFDIIARKLSPLTDYVYLHLMGEPLTHPDLPELISIASSHGLKVAITTNGTLLPKRAAELLESDVYKVSISVHSFEDGTDEDYERYINGCIDFADKASEKGILTVFRLWNVGHDGGRNERTVNMLKARFAEPWTYGKRGARIRHRLHLEYGERFAWPDADMESLGDEVFCYGLGDHFGVLSDGTVVPCCLDKDADIPLGNALSGNLSEILASERAENIRCGFAAHRAEEELCKRCGYARRFKV